MDSPVYEVSFQDGRTSKYAIQIFQQVKTEGNSFSNFSEIVDHWADDTPLMMKNGFIEKDGILVPLKLPKDDTYRFLGKTVPPHGRH